MKRVVIAIVSVTSAAAIAGKLERELMKNEVVPAVREAEAKFKEACGCSLTITVDKSLVSLDDLYAAKHMAGYVTDGAPGYCTDAESKKAVCKMRQLTFMKAKEATFSFSAGKGVATTDGQSACSWDMMTRELDK